MVRPSQLVPRNDADHSTNSVKCKTSSVFPDDQSRLIGWTRPGASSSVRNSHLMPCVQQPTTGAMLWSLTSRAYQQFDQDFEDRAVRKNVLGGSACGSGPHLTSIWFNQRSYTKTEGSRVGTHYDKAKSRYPARPEERLRKERLEVDCVFCM